MQVFVAGCDAVERRSGLIVFHDVVLDTRLLGLRKDLFPVDDPAADRRHVLERVTEILAAPRRNLRKVLNILDVDQGKASGIAFKVFERVGAGDRDPAEVKLHLDQVWVAHFEEQIVRKLPIDGEELEPVVVIGKLDAGLLASFSGTVESFRRALPTVGLLADVRGDPGTDDVTLTDDFGGLYLARPLIAEDIPRDMAGR